MVGSGDKQSSGGSAQAVATGGAAAHDTSGVEWGSTLSGPKAVNDGAAKLRIELFGSGLTSAVRPRPRAPLPLSRLPLPPPIFLTAGGLSSSQTTAALLPSPPPPCHYVPVAGASLVTMWPSPSLASLWSSPSLPGEAWDTRLWVQSCKSNEEHAYFGSPFLVRQRNMLR